MNTTRSNTRKTLLTQAQFAKKMTTRLNAGNLELDHHLVERLRVARERALDAHAQTAIQWAQAPSSSSMAQANGTLVMGGGNSNWMDSFGKWTAWIPLLALVAGLFVVSHIQSELRASEVAALDTALLTDDLPPAAYADVGFARFLKLQVETDD